MEYNNVQREVNIVDICKYVCSKWKYILIAAVVVAVAALGTSYVQYTQTVEQQKQATGNANDVQNDVEFSKTGKANIVTYQEYNRLLEQYSKYRDTSPLMLMDADGFYKTTLSYYVDNYFTVEYPLVSKNNDWYKYVEAYKAVLESPQFREELLTIMGGEENAGDYYYEVVDTKNIYGTTSVTSMDAGMMTIAVYHSEKEKCVEIAELVKRTIEGQMATISSTIGEHALTLLSDNCSLTSDKNLLNFQKANIDELYNVSVGIDNILLRLTAEEKKYVGSLKTNLATQEQTKELVEEVEVAPFAVDKTLVIIGFIAGAFIAIFVLVIKYLFVTKLQREDDFEQIYGVKVLGKLKNKGKDGLLDENIKMMVTSLKILLGKGAHTRVLLAGAHVSEEEKTILHKLVEQLGKSDIKAEIGDSIMCSAESFEKAANSGCVVLVEHINKSKYGEIKQSIEKLQYHNIKVMGSIILE